MSIRTTVTLDDDVIERVKRESRARGTSFRETLNELLRWALLEQETKPRRKLGIAPVHLGYRAGVNRDDVASLIDYGEGERHR